jgi:ABC-type phosphate transport system substrate-binding protein
VRRESFCHAFEDVFFRSRWWIIELRWSDGTELSPFNLPEGNALRQGFDATVLGLRPPQTAPSPAVWLAVVSKTPSAIGYVDMKLVDANVKVIAKVVNGVVTKP